MSSPNDGTTSHMAPLGAARTEDASQTDPLLPDNISPVLGAVETEAESADFFERLASIKLRELLTAADDGAAVNSFRSKDVPLFNRFVRDLSPTEFANLKHQAECAAFDQLLALININDDDDICTVVAALDDLPEYVSLPDFVRP